jgi:hypothetical protein
MTDIVAVMFLIGVACLFSVLVFVFRHSMLCVIAGIIWGSLGIYNFNYLYNSGDSDAGQMVWVFGWICLALTFAFWTAPLWLLKMKMEDKPKPEVKDHMTQVNDRVAQIRKFRPKKRDPFWN